LHVYRNFQYSLHFVTLSLSKKSKNTSYKNLETIIESEMMDTSSKIKTLILYHYLKFVIAFSNILVFKDFSGVLVVQVFL